MSKTAIIAAIAAVTAALAATGSFFYDANIFSKASKEQAIQNTTTTGKNSPVVIGTGGNVEIDFSNKKVGK